MNAPKTMRWSGLLVALVLLLAGCGGAGGESGSAAGGEDAGLDFTLTSFARTDTSAQQSFAQALSAPLEATIDVHGELLAVNKDEGTEERFRFDLRVDAAAFQIDGAVNVALPPGTYDFHFLLDAGAHSYAGSVLNQIVQPTGGSATTQNRIPFTLNPVIAVDTVTLEDIRDLVLFRFRFNSTEVSTYADPVFSIGVNGGAHEVFSINTQTGLEYVYVLLPAGHYVFEINFYDAANLKLAGTLEADLPTDEELEAELTPIVTEVRYTYTPTSSPSTDSGDVTFIVPAAIVEQGGGESTVRASAAVVGPLTPLLEADLALAPAGDGVYTATVVVPGLTAGPLTWSIQFRDGLDGTLYAYCAETVTIESESGRFVCEPRLIARNVTTDDPPAPLTVQVSDPEVNVSGAVVTANGEPIGITSGGTIPGEVLGYLQSFLPGDTYLLKATHEQLDPYGSGQVVSRSGEIGVGLVPGQAREVGITLPALLPPGELCADGLTLTASKTYQPSTWYDGICEMPEAMLVTVPESLQVAQGDAGNHWARLYLERADGSRVVCMYQGNGVSAGNGTTYLPHHCYANDPQQLPPDGEPLEIQPGDPVLADAGVRLRINGALEGGTTVVHYTLAAVPAPEDDQTLPDDGGGPAGAPGDDGGDVNAPELDTIVVTASRGHRPRRYYDDDVRLSDWAKIRLPGHDRVSVPEGDPDRFLMIVYFGRGIKCWYLGGQWDSTVGGFLDRFFHQTFDSPACNSGLQAGDTIWVRGPLKARVVGGNAGFKNTTVRVEIPVIRAAERDDDGAFDSSLHNRRHGWRWWWWRALEQ